MLYGVVLRLETLQDVVRHRRRGRRSLAWTSRDRVAPSSLLALEFSTRPEATKLLMPWELGEEPMWPMSVIRGELRVRDYPLGRAAE